MNKPLPYLNEYLLQLDKNTWYEIGSVPRVIGIRAIFEAAREQILKPEYEIQIGRLYATFRIVRTKTETIRIMERIQKAI